MDKKFRTQLDLLKTDNRLKKQNRFETHHWHNSEILYLVPENYFSLWGAFLPPPLTNSEGSMLCMLQVLEAGKGHEFGR